MAIDLALATDSYDLAFDGLDLRLVDRENEVAQRIKLKLTTHLGETVLTERLGLPWLEVLLGNEASAELCAGLIYNQIERCEGVKSITSFAVTADNEKRTASISFSAETIYGEFIAVENFEVSP